jgi:hypothetical protein
MRNSAGENSDCQAGLPSSMIARNRNRKDMRRGG